MAHPGFILVGSLNSTGKSSVATDIGLSPVITAEWDKEQQLEKAQWDFASME